MRYYKIVQEVSRNTDVCYKVSSADSWLGMIFGFWTDYAKENQSLEEAMNHIRDIHGYQVVSRKKIMQVSAKELTNQPATA